MEKSCRSTPPPSGRTLDGMITARLTLDADRVMADLEARAWEGIQRATVYYWLKLEEVLSTPNTGERRKSRFRKTPSGRAAGYTVYPDPSRPGEAPRKRTGFGQRNVVYQLDRASLSSKVGVRQNAKYMLYLELGTRRIQPRPWLVATLDTHRERLKALALGMVNG